MKYSAVDIANYFVALYKHDEEHPTNLKLNKLVYYAQGHSLARFGRSLFDESIEAWDYGPVVPSVYAEYKKNARRGIRTVSRPLPSFDPEDEALLLDVARCYGKYTGSELTNLTHRQGTPWREVYVEGKKFTPISLEAIKSYFSEVEKKLPTIDEEIGEITFGEWNDGV